MNEKQAKCLLCDSPVSKRGLCKAHYQRFLRARGKLPKNMVLAFEEELVKQGKLLSPRQPGQLDSDDFSKLAQQMMDSAIARAAEKVVEEELPKIQESIDRLLSGSPPAESAESQQKPAIPAKGVVGAPKKRGKAK